MWPFAPIPSVSAADAAQKLQTQNTVLVDVRTPEEFASGHATGAQNIPLDTLGAPQAEQLKNFSAVYVMCQSGGRSSVAVSKLISAGVHAVNVAGGLSSWRESGLPLG